jgi:hypothetical protein
VKLIGHGRSASYLIALSLAAQCPLVCMVAAGHSFGRQLVAAAFAAAGIVCGVVIGADTERHRRAKEGEDR